MVKRIEALAALLLALCLALPRAGFARQATPYMYIHCMDVGQADCTLLEFPCGAVLVDAGSDPEHEGVPKEFLEDFFRRRTDLNRTLELVVITHSHIDHTSRLRDIVETFNVKRVIDNGDREGSGKAGLLWLQKEVESGARSVKFRAITQGDVDAADHPTGLTDDEIDPLRCAGCDPVLRILASSPDEDPGWPTGEFDDENNHSVVLRVEFGASAALFTGDLETPAIESLVDRYAGGDALDVDVYHVGHHGSLNGTTTELLEAMTPQVAVISMGRWNYGRKPDGTARPFTTFAYSHPRIETLEMLKASIPGKRSEPVNVRAGLGRSKFKPYAVSKRIYATGWDGDIEIRADLTRRYRVRRSNQ